MVSEVAHVACTEMISRAGLINMAELRAAIRPDTALLSVMAVNNEIGVIQPLKEIGDLCRENKVFFHTDGAQVYVHHLS